MDGHVGMILDLAALLDVPYERDLRRAELAAILAAGSGDIALGLKAAPAKGVPPSPAVVRRALVKAGERLLRVHFPPETPPTGCPSTRGR